MWNAALAVLVVLVCVRLLMFGIRVMLRLVFAAALLAIAVLALLVLSGRIKLFPPYI